MKSVVEGLAENVMKSVHFKDERFRDNLYVLAKHALIYESDLTASPAPYVALCKLNTMRYMRPVPENLSYAQLALQRAENSDAVSYYCKAAIYNNEPADTLQLLDALRKSREWSLGGPVEIISLYEAQCLYLVGDFDGFLKKTREFKQSVANGFRHYIAIPASTILTEPLHEDSFSETLSIPGMPVVRTPSLPSSADYIVSVSCDRKYFEQYASYFIASLEKTGDNFLCLVAISDQLDCHPENTDPRFVFVQHGLSGVNIGPMSSILRMFHAANLLERHNVPVVVLDFDSVVLLPLSGLIDAVGDVDIGFRVLEKTLTWEKFTGGVSVYSPTATARVFMKNLRAFCNQTLVSDSVQWWVDQNALEAALRTSAASGDAVIYRDIISIRNRFIVQPTGSGEVKRAHLDEALARIL